MSYTRLRKSTNESVPEVEVRSDTVLDEASEAGIVAPINNSTNISNLEIFIELTKNNNRRYGAGSLTMIVQNDQEEYNQLEFHRTTRYNELKTLASFLENNKGEKLALGFPDSFCDKTSTLTEKCTIARTKNIEQYFMNVINVYGRWEENDKFLEFLQEKKKWRVKERKSRSRGGGKKTRKRNRKRKGGKKTSKRKRKGKRKTRKRKKSLKKRRRGRKRTKRRR